MIPISTLYASAANIRRDLFCAFHTRQTYELGFVHFIASVGKDNRIDM